VPDRLELVYRLRAGELHGGVPAADWRWTRSLRRAVTTCDALWMGVPVLTVAGRDAAGGKGVSILTALGLPEFVADTPEQLVDLAATWAEQRDALAELAARSRSDGTVAVTAALRQATRSRVRRCERRSRQLLCFSAPDGAPM